jgi:hypothetical protein
MAILAEYPGLEADVIVNNVACKEYPEPAESNEDTPNSVTKYIEVQDGVNFAVRLRIDHRFQHIQSDLCWGVLLDGQVMNELVLVKAIHANGTTQVIDHALGGSKGNFYHKKFFFSALNTSKFLMILYYSDL